MSAPMVSASLRRAGLKSAAMIGCTPLILSAAMTASPTGPQPMTSGMSSGVRRAFSTACQPTAIGSVSAACSVGKPVRHFEQQHLVQHHVLGKAAGQRV